MTIGPLLKRADQATVAVDHALLEGHRVFMGVRLGRGRLRLPFHVMKPAEAEILLMALDVLSSEDGRCAAFDRVLERQ